MIAQFGASARIAVPVVPRFTTRTETAQDCEFAHDLMMYLKRNNRSRLADHLELEIRNFLRDGVWTAMKKEKR